MLGIVLFSACKKDEVEIPTTPSIVLDTAKYDLKYGNFPPPMIPPDNPLTIEKVKLGKMLFYEKKLSNDLTMACADCHKQSDAFTDIRKFSIGTAGKEGGRQAMAIFNLAWHKSGFFWDGRAPMLRDQALLPIQDPLEMNETLENVVIKLEGETLYKNQFLRAFGSNEITSEKMGLALEQFMMTILSMNAKYDLVEDGQASYTPSEQRGKKLFFTEYNEFLPNKSGADCAHCHGGPNFENGKFMNNGLDKDSEFKDNGLEDVTSLAIDIAKFKVPTLRNIELTFPYMHDGRFSTLEEVIDHYNSGIDSSSTLDGALLATKRTGLRLSAQDKLDLVAFLKTLTDPTLKDVEEYKTPF